MQRVAISNIAWPKEHDGEALALCARLGFTGVEIAPGRSFAGWPQEAADVDGLKAATADHGLAVVALQGILYGVEGAELFVSAQTRARLAEHLRKVAVLAGALGAGACVYGSPRSRDPGSLPIGTARDIATEFLASVAGAFEAEGTRLAFEANDPSYGCRFITRTAEAIDLVSRVDRPGIRVQIDTGTVFLGHEDVAIIGEAVCLAGHVHASEPWLRPLASANSGHRAVAAALTGKGYDGWISVEMRESKDWRENMERAAQVARAVYRPPLGRAP